MNALEIIESVRKGLHHSSSYNKTSGKEIEIENTKSGMEIPDELVVSSIDDKSKSSIGSIITRREADDGLGYSDADVAIVVALSQPEADSVKRVFCSEWYTEGREGITFKVGHAELGSSQRRVVLAIQNSMGLVPAAITATKTIRAWNPSIICMSGICAGVEDKTNLGDVVFARQILDYGSGKLKDGALIPDYSPVAIDSSVCSKIIDMSSNSDILAEIRASWPSASGRPSTDLVCHVGTFGSGAAVIADAGLVDETREHARSLLGIDMEAYSVARSAAEAPRGPIPCVIVKGIQDYADARKSDEYRDYASYVSAKVLKVFLDMNIDDIIQR